MERNKQYDTAKGLTALLVVLAHTAVMYTPQGAFHPLLASPFLAAVTEYIYSFHMPVFFFLSGCLYGLGCKRGKYKNGLALIKTKTKRLLLPYIVVGLLYVAPVMQWLKLDASGYGSYAWKGILLNQNSRHLWFLVALFWIFCLSIPVRGLQEKGIVGQGAIFLLSTGLWLAAPMVPGDFQLYAAAYYQLYFFAGVLFIQQERKCHTWLWPICALLLLGQFWLPQSLAGKTAFAFLGIGLVLSLSQCCRLPQWICRNSFGIYLFHPMLNYVIYYFLGNTHTPPVLLSMLGFGLSTALSVAISEGLRKCKLGWLLGE